MKLPIFLFEMNNGSQFDENAVCDVCGRFGAHAFGNSHLCGDCYEAQGSCCPEFGREEECARADAVQRKPDDMSGSVKEVPSPGKHGG
jgi:hypothetical protein